MLYKVIEVSIVTEDGIESALNQWVTNGWQFDSIHFVVRENSRRPSMAFVFFVQESPPELTVVPLPRDEATED